MRVKAKLRGLLPKNSFIRSVSVLAGGTAAGQGVTVLASPLLTRLYSPEDFGLLAVFAALLAIIGVVASFRYHLAIPLPKSDEEAAHVMVLSLLLLISTTLACAIAVAAFGDSIARTLAAPALANYLWLLPIGLLLTGVYQIFNYWAIRTKSFSVIARTKFMQSTSMVAVQVAAYAIGPLALLIGRVLGQAAGTTTLGLLAVRNRWGLFRRVRLPDIGLVAKRYKRFPIYSTWAGGFNTAGHELPPLLFAALFSPAAAGIYMLAQRVLAMPMTLIGRAIGDVFLSHASAARHQGGLRKLVAEVHEKLAQIAMPPTLLLIAAGPELFVGIFGEDWRQAGTFSQWLAPYLYFQFVASPLSSITTVLEKQAEGMLFQVVLLVCRVISLAVGAYYHDLVLAVALFGLSSAVCWMGYLACVVRWSGNAPSVLVSSTGSAFMWGFLAISPMVAASVLLAPWSVLWVSALAVSASLVAFRYLAILKKAS